MLEADLSDILSPAVLAPLPPPMALGPGGIKAWINARASEAHVLTIRFAGQPNIIGLLILAGDETTLHLGYLLSEAVWGQGLASELVAGLVRALPSGTRLIGGVDPGNPASARVLEKAGFTRDPELSDSVDMFVRIV